ncbi:MAG: methyl-accepting chemotaxis protein [Spirochaetia bacterium]|nr:methyl-accepting chemotaxis protein [Spirochaetia bacterium]
MSKKKKLLSSFSTEIFLVIFITGAAFLFLNGYSAFFLKKDTEYIIYNIVPLIILSFAAITIVTFFIYKKLVNNRFKKLFLLLFDNQKDLILPKKKLSLLKALNFASELIDKKQQYIKILKTKHQFSEEIVKDVLSFTEGLYIESENQEKEITAVSEALNALAISIENISRSLFEQASASDKTKEAFSAFHSSTADLFKNISAVNDQSMQTLGKSYMGSDIMEQNAASIARIRQSAEQIGEIIEVINGISEKTNLLALNASIEAARAGAHGRGFAVVADEVAKLAEKSSVSAKQVGDLIENNLEAAREGHEMSESAHASFQEISESVQEMTDLIQQVNAYIGDEKKYMGNLTERIDIIKTANEQISQGLAAQNLKSQNIVDSMNILGDTTKSFNSGLKTIIELMKEIYNNEKDI